ncbi:PREDICTED: kinesin-like protein KIN-7F [Lupinus angustifolius]|uniref:kinesin-like protein KIN-7F n=1 Tax=Lupinus angustifolius TaxID=3871 RepID=UPI00092F658E|nr:PREDICTED: kinesin-like protein KIN-7F [Lupinus angustifolius]XP_019424474.1 PREDICTED: kinesin-like protein KIN-7F [Lupinus angustifolius]
MGSTSGESVQGAEGHEERIVVSVRVRPLNDKELAKNDVSEWECSNDTTIIYRSNVPVSDRSLYPTAYSFDRVFRPDCPTRKVYEEAAKEVALSVLSGINSSIFAYGQTCSGKTYTMSGITEYAVTDIFNYIENHKEREYVVKFSALEIYNESVRDLLSTDTTPLRLLDDRERGTVVEKLTEETVLGLNHFEELLFFCETQRQIGETSLNEASSRSHQILRLTIESSACESMVNGKPSSLAASVNFVDLAGSERASQTNSAGTRLKEGCHINRSLLTLGTVIRKLSKGRNGHIPFRDSKLTRILQSSLGGNARTAIICTMSPARSHVEQSRNTLLFASCAKEVATNAQVNEVMSDKALVRQLQRELTRLESELRNSGSTQIKSDPAALLREKDLQIQKLMEEVTDLTLQRDLAQSQITDMFHVVGDDMASTEMESMDPQYPKLRVRSSWDFESLTEEPNFSYFDLESVKSFDASQYSDGHSISSDDNYFQLPDLEKNLPIRLSPPGLPIAGFAAVRNDLDQKNMEEHHHENFGVRCIESEDLITNTYTPLNPSDLSLNLHTDSNVSSPGVNNVVSGLTEDDKREKENLDLCSSMLKENKVSNQFNQDFVLPSPGKISAWLAEYGASSSRSLKLTRSRSCKATLLRDSSPNWFEEDIIQSTPFTGIPGGFQRKSCTLNYNDKDERLSWTGHGNFVGSAAIDVQNVKPSADEVNDGNSVLALERKENKDPESSNLLANHVVPETESEPIIPAKEFKDVGLDPMQSDEENHSDWSLQFKRLQKEIIELWHACNISLIHRTYFFLLFKGDPSDSIYMEVELRRLSYLKQTFSKVNQTMEDGQNLTSQSNTRYLRRERQMLSRRMRWKLSKSEREKLFLKWGIRMSSKNRSLQLAHRLWSDTEHIDKIRESAAIVSKLVGSVEPDHAFKEMFGLNFAPQSRRKKSFGWAATIKHIL